MKRSIAEEGSPPEHEEKRFRNNSHWTAADGSSSATQTPFVYYYQPRRAPQLPSELWLLIFSFMDTDTLISACRVCNTWKELTEQNSLWQVRYEKASLKPISSEQVMKSLKQVGGSWKKLYMRELLHMEELLFKEVIIGRGAAGFQLHSHKISSLLNMRRDMYFGLDDTVPDSLRDFGAILQYVKKAQSSGYLSSLHIVKIPSDVKWKIKRHPLLGYEWIEEEHRVWKADRSSRACNKLHTERNLRKRHIVIDVSGAERLLLSEAAFERLAHLTHCSDREHLTKIPRDHPALLQTVMELGDAAGELQIISIPIDCKWFIGCKNGIEFISESFRRWPEPTPAEVTELSSQVKVVGNRLEYNGLTRSEWELQRPDAVEDGFSALTQELENSWSQTTPSTTFEIIT